MEIYKEQQQLREALQNELNKQGLGGQGQNALDQMKQIEKQLLKEEQLINLDRFKKLDKMLCESFVDI